MVFVVVVVVWLRCASFPLAGPWLPSTGESGWLLLLLLLLLPGARQADIASLDTTPR